MSMENENLGMSHQWQGYAAQIWMLQATSSLVHAKTDMMPWDPTVASTPLECPGYSGDVKPSSPLPQPLAQESLPFISWGILQQ